MRLTVPVGVFLCFALLYLGVEHDTAGMMSALPTRAHEYTSVAIGIAFWLSLAWVVNASLTWVILHRAHRRGTHDKTPQLLIDIGAVAIYFCAALVIVSQVFEQSLTGLLATSGIFAAVVGLAVQKTIADLMSGIALNVEQGIKLGDWIETGGLTGQAVEINWRATHLVTIDGRMIVVPNSSLVGNHFTNFNAPDPYFRMARKIELDYEAPPQRVVPILQNAMEMTDGVLEDPRPVVLIDELADNGIVYSMNFWVPDYPRSFVIAREVITTALRFLDQAGFSPPYPRRDVTFFEASARQIEHKADVGDALRRVPLLRSFDAATLGQLESRVNLKEFAPQSVVVREGDPGDSLFFVVEGVLDVSKQSQATGSRRVGRLAPGDVFGEMSLLTGTPRSATITAASKTTLLEINKQDLEPLLTKHPAAIAELSQLEAARLATNESVMALWPEERQEIAEVGIAAFLRDKIARFFGSGA